MGQVVTAEKIRQARDFYKLHFGYNLFNEEGQFNIIKRCYIYNFVLTSLLHVNKYCMIGALGPSRNRKTIQVIRNHQTAINFDENQNCAQNPKP